MLAAHLDSGALSYREDVRYGGLEDVPQAFTDLIHGRTHGKARTGLVAALWLHVCGASRDALGLRAPPGLGFARAWRCVRRDL